MKKLAVIIAVLGLMGCGGSDGDYVSYDLKREMILNYNGKVLVVDLAHAETQYMNQNIPVKISAKIVVSSGESCTFDVYLQRTGVYTEYILTFDSKIYQSQCDSLEKSFNFKHQGNGQGVLSDDIQ